MTGYNKVWRNKTDNILQSDINLFVCNVLYTEDLCKNNYSFNRTRNGIAYNDFTPVTMHKISNFNFKWQKDVDLLKNLNVKNKMIEFLNDDIAELQDQIADLKQRKRELKQQYNVCFV